MTDALAEATTTVWTGTFHYSTLLERRSGSASWADKRRRLLDDLVLGDRLVPYVACIYGVGRTESDTDGLRRRLRTLRKDKQGRPYA